MNIHQANDVMEYPDEKMYEFISIRFSLKCFPTEVDISNNLYLVLWWKKCINNRVKYKRFYKKKSYGGCLGKIETFDIKNWGP